MANRKEPIMQEFTSRYNDKEITFKEEGIRYNNQAFIKYDDMEEVSVNNDNCVFRYKGHLIKMDFDPADAAKIETYFVRPKEPVMQAKEQFPPIDNSALNAELDKFSYLDQAQQQAPVENLEENPKKKMNKKTSIIIGAIVAVAAIAIALIILL